MRATVLSELVRVLYVCTDTPMGLPRVRELAKNVEAIHLEGGHLEAMQRIGKPCEDCTRVGKAANALFLGENDLPST